LDDPVFARPKDYSNLPRSVLDAPLSRGMTRIFSVIPGHREAANPESRGSGSVRFATRPE
jgi:hypothetical protein